MIPDSNHGLVCIVGAGRSGTSFLARSLATMSNGLDIGENRYVWSYGQRDRRVDLRRGDEVTDRIRQRISAHLDYLGKNSSSFVFDHTPSNAFRIPFIHAIFPQARFIHIVRDGRDNVLSRMKQWQRPWLDRAAPKASANKPSRMTRRLKEIHSSYIEFRRLQRRGNLPTDCWLPAALDRAEQMSKRLVGAEITYRFGERAPGLNDYLRHYGLGAAAAIQWREAALNAHYGGKNLASDHFLEIYFESLLTDPITTFKTVFDYLNLSYDHRDLEAIARQVRGDNIDKWKLCENNEVEVLEPQLRPTLDFFGYQ